jgi:hypothetical protein
MSDRADADDRRRQRNDSPAAPGEPDASGSDVPDGVAARDSPRELAKWVSGFASLVGLWIAVSPFLYAATATAFWNDLLVGVAIFVIAGYNYYRVTSGHVSSINSASLVALLGVWTLLAPFVLEMGSTELFWSNLVGGALVALLAGYNAYANRSVDTSVETRA